MSLFCFFLYLDKFCTISKPTEWVLILIVLFLKSVFLPIELGIEVVVYPGKIQFLPQSVAVGPQYPQPEIKRAKHDFFSQCESDYKSLHNFRIFFIIEKNEQNLLY